MDLFGKEPRPTRKSINWEPLINTISKDIMRWSGDSDLDSTKLIVKELIIEKSPNQDAYELAKNFEEHGYIVDFEFCEILNDAMWEVDEYFKTQVEKWVKTDNIEPLLNKDDEVKVVLVGREKIGKIIRVYKERAEYVVYVPGENKSETEGYLLSFESVEELNKK